jgi:hypothetical protein
MAYTGILALVLARSVGKVVVIQGAAEIVKHFKFKLHASPLEYRGVQMLEHKQ